MCVKVLAIGKIFACQPLNLKAQAQVQALPERRKA